MLSKFSNASVNESRPSSAILLKRQIQTNKIETLEMTAATKVIDGVLHLSKCTPTSSGYYHISAQFGIENTSASPVRVEHLQHGFCAYSAEMTDYESNFKSTPIESNCGQGIVIADSFSTICSLEAGVEYTVWINLISDSNAAFQYRSDLSHVRLYKL